MGAHLTSSFEGGIVTGQEYSSLLAVTILAKMTLVWSILQELHMDWRRMSRLGIHIALQMAPVIPSFLVDPWMLISQ